MTRTVSLSLLDQVRIASPCPMKWEQMNRTSEGDHTRHCAACDLNVYNLSAMTREEGEEFLVSRIGTERTCAAFYRRTDGTILTRDCPVGLAAARARLARVIGRVAAGFGVVISAAALARSRERDDRLSRLDETRPFSLLCNLVRGAPAVTPPPAPGGILLGRVCEPLNPPIVQPQAPLPGPVGQ